MSESKRLRSKPASTSEGRTFLFRLFLLLALMALVAWAGWFAPWSRADTRVVVEAVDSNGKR